MSLHPPACDVIPEQTIQVARAAFPKGNPYMGMRDAVPSIRTRHSLPSFRIPDARRKPQPSSPSSP
jgi:hypothetical protein